jgi:hypothetical protein
MSEREMASQATQRWISNAQMRAALQVVGELLGRNGHNAVLRLAGLERYIDQLPPDNDQLDIPRGDVSTLFAGIVSMFGDQGARGVFRRWGHAFAVQRARRRFALRLLRPALRLFPPERSVRLVLERLLHHIDLAREDQPPALEDRGDAYLLELTDCVYCYTSNQTQPTCPTVIGLLEGLLRWATGHDFDVTEERSAAPGTQQFKIRKRPISRR